MKRNVRTHEHCEYVCDACGTLIQTDNGDSTFIRHVTGQRGYRFHFHTDCLVEHLRRTYLFDQELDVSECRGPTRGNDEHATSCSQLDDNAEPAIE